MRKRCRVPLIPTARVTLLVGPVTDFRRELGEQEQGLLGYTCGQHPHYYIWLPDRKKTPTAIHELWHLTLRLLKDYAGEIEEEWGARIIEHLYVRLFTK